MLTIQRGKDKRTVHALLINLADLPDGVTIQTSELVIGTRLIEGSLVGRDSSGVGHLIKTAKVKASVGADGTTYNVEKGSHFKVGDFIMLEEGAAAYAITAIDRDSSTVYDTITVGTTLGAATAGDVLKQAAAESADASVLKYEPEALLGESYEVEKGENLFVSAVTMGQFKSALVPAIDAELKAALLANGAYINFV